MTIWQWIVVVLLILWLSPTLFEVVWKSFVKKKNKKMNSIPVKDKEKS